MSNAPVAKELPPPGPQRSLAVTGLSFSVAGVVGWFIMLALILSIPKENYTGDGQRDLVAGFANFFAYLFQVVIGLVGLSVTSVLSLSGTVISVAAHNHGPSSKSTAGIVVGFIGILLGVALVIYRMNAWGVFST